MIPLLMVSAIIAVIAAALRLWQANEHHEELLDAFAHTHVEIEELRHDIADVQARILKLTM